MLGGGVKIQGLPGGKIKERRPEGRGLVSCLKKIGQLRHFFRLEEDIPLEDIAVQGVDFPVETREVPGREIILVETLCLRTLQKAPAVALEIVPVPAGQHELHDGLKVRRHEGHLRFQKGDFFRRLVSLDDGLQGQALDQGFERLPFLPDFQGQGGDVFEMSSGGLGEAVLLGLVSFLPQLLEPSPRLFRLLALLHRHPQYGNNAYDHQA